MKLESLLPFMDKEDINTLVDRITSGELKDIPLAIVIPFIGKDKRHELFDYLIQEGNADELYQMLPFMSKDDLNALSDKVQAGELEGFAEEALLPFLGKDKIRSLIEAAIKDTLKDTQASVKSIFEANDED